MHRAKGRAASRGAKPFLEDLRALAVGDYVVVDLLMVVYRPNFLHEPILPNPLPLAKILKFATDPHLALIYSDASFYVYRVMTHP